MEKYKKDIYVCEGGRFYKKNQSEPNLSESLACHPFSMTHCDVSVETKNKIGMGESLVRLSIGIEDSNDLIEDIKNSLDKI